MRGPVLSLALLAACASSAGGAPAVKKRYPGAAEIVAYTGYRAPGLSLFLVQMPSAADRSGDRFVVGVDPKRRIVEGVTLFRRVSDGLPPADVVRRAFDTLLARAGGAGIDPAIDRRSTIYPEDEWALVRAPALADGVITFWFSRGEMHPELTRGRLTVATGALEIKPAHQILHPPEDAIPGIREKLHATDPATVRVGLGQVASWEALAPDVEALLEHDDATIRGIAADVLGNLGLARSVPPLVRALERGPGWADRSRVAQVLLFRIGTPEAVAAVKARLARATETSEIYVLREMVADHAAGKRR